MEIWTKIDPRFGQKPIPDAGGQDYRASNQGIQIQETPMRVVTVYRVDYARKTRNPIGVVLEKRETERLHNHHGQPYLPFECNCMKVK